MSKAQRELLSQNFLWNRELVGKLIRGSSISKNDFVLEIGPGKGIITEQLLDVCNRLTAVEVDQKLLSFLKGKLPALQRLSLLPGDFLEHPLPQFETFKVFSNIPFSITGEVIKRLLFSQNPPVDSYLVIQKEAAEKIIAKKSGNTMVAVLFYPWFDIKIVHDFQRSDFKPTPRVESCLVRIEKRVSPFVDKSFLSLYRDFIVYHFTRDRSATSSSSNGWLSRFDGFVKRNDLREHNKINGLFSRWRVEERKLSKIHRTRTDKDWSKQKSDAS